MNLTFITENAFNKFARCHRYWPNFRSLKRNTRLTWIPAELINLWFSWSLLDVGWPWDEAAANSLCLGSWLVEDSPRASECHPQWRSSRGADCSRHVHRWSFQWCWPVRFLASRQSAIYWRRDENQARVDQRAKNLKCAESIIVPGAMMRYEGRTLCVAHSWAMTSNGWIAMIMTQSGAKKESSWAISAHSGASIA